MKYAVANMAAVSRIHAPKPILPDMFEMGHVWIVESEKLIAG